MDRHGKSDMKIQKYTKDDRLIDLIHRQLILERYELHHFSAYGAWLNRGYIPDRFDTGNLDLMMEEGYEKYVEEYKFFFPHAKEDDERYERLDILQHKLKNMIIQLEEECKSTMDEFISGKNPRKFFYPRQTDNQAK